MDRTININSTLLDTTREYRQPEPHDLKPVGLWYAIDGEWLEWCKSEMPHWIKPDMIKLDVDESRILIIETEQQLRDFCAEFGYKLHDFLSFIRWDKVREKYSGIEIRNYHDLKWSDFRFTMEHIWISALDVSSGCIWDLSAVKSHFRYIFTPAERKVKWDINPILAPRTAWL